MSKQSWDESLVAAWNGEDSTFIFEGDIYTEGDVQEAMDRIEEDK